MSTKKSTSIDSIGGRIRAFRLDSRLTLVQLANLLKISHGSLSGLENDKSKPSAETLSSFCLYTEINIEWLLTGKGSMRRKKELVQGKQRAGRKNPILNEVDEWLDEEIKRNPERKIWFEIHFLDSFQSFKEWRRKRDSEKNSEDESATRKVA